jgi:hypothetical protein
MGTCKKCNKISCFNFENQKFGEYCNIIDNIANNKKSWSESKLDIILILFYKRVPPFQSVTYSRK